MKVRLVWAAESLDEEEKEVEIEGKKAGIEDILRKAGINPVTVLVKVDDKIVPVEDEIEGEEDVILELIPVVSGG